jgi:anti-anti-sigma regulatory factor
MTMGTVEVVDRGSLEIVVFMSGEIDDDTRAAMDSALEQVSRLEPQRVVVDTHDATSFGPTGVAFLDALRDRGRAEGFEVDLAAIGPEVRPVLEASGWIHPILHPHHEEG